MDTVRPVPIVRRRRRLWPSDWRFRRAVIFACLLAIIGLILWLLFHPRATEVRVHSVPVTVTTVRRASMPIELRSIGTVTPINSVAVKAHVAGQILQTHFREGQLVTAGQLLFSIDPRPLQAALGQARADVLNKQAVVAQTEAAVTKDQALLVQAQANKAKDIAVAANATTEAQRYAGLARQGAVSTEQYEQFRTTMVSARATVAADEAAIRNAQAQIKADQANVLSAKAMLAASEAALKNAEVQLSYTQVTAPITGLAGNIQVLNGNLVRADTDTLVTVNQIAPIYVSLTVPQQQFSQVRQFAGTGAVTANAYASTGGLLESDGRLVFENNTVDTTTGTVMLKSLFANAGQKLWPGQFVNMVLTLAVSPNAIVVPDRAIQTGQNGTFVWLVKTDTTAGPRGGRERPRSQGEMSAYMQPVTAAQSVRGYTVVTSGLTPGQTVVTDGQLQLREGVHVAISQLQGL